MVLSGKRRLLGNFSVITTAMACSLVSARTNPQPALSEEKTASPSPLTEPSHAMSTTPTGCTDPPLLITPYVEEADMIKAMGFSWSADSPWGFKHTGIDFMPGGDLRAFRAVCAGSVEKVELWQLETTLNWQVSVRLVCNERYSAIYAFEPMTAVRSDGKRQLENIQVQEGQPVDQGDVIGLLPYTGPDCHVDFGFYDGWERICPEPFFMPEAKQSILRLIHRGWPSAEMCY
jgi:hypothetical protein